MRLAISLSMRLSRAARSLECSEERMSMRLMSFASFIKLSACYGWMREGGEVDGKKEMKEGWRVNGCEVRGGGGRRVEV